MTQVADERSVRIQKGKKLVDRGVDPYPSATARTATCRECLDHFDSYSTSGRQIVIVGRIRGIRRHGGSSFFILEDESGRIQVLFRRDGLGQDGYELIKESVDMGDFLEVAGTLMVTKTGEKTLQGSDARLISKALLPLPEQWHGLSDVEIRYRRRYLDLLSNSDVRKIFEQRSQIVKEIRSFFESRDFLEVDTPVLQSVPGGAAARPFATRHLALDQEMYLRIAPELFLKRLIIGGFERVFEFARCFRNEGVDHSHNPEFTMLEAYAAYCTYEDLMGLVEDLCVRVVSAVHGSMQFHSGTHMLDIRPPFARLSFWSALETHLGMTQDACSADSLRVILSERGMSTDPHATYQQLLDIACKKFVLGALVQPTFLYDHPVELSPLSKKKKSNSRLVERFQLVIMGLEVVNAFSEVNDPLDQRDRFEQQARLREQGDVEAHPVDEEFLTALEYGMPPTAGLGIGIDRLVALITNSHSLKEVILFPTLREKQVV